MSCKSLPTREIAVDLREWLCSILGEHGDHNLVHNLKFRPIKRSDLNEDVLGI